MTSVERTNGLVRNRFQIGPFFLVPFLDFPFAFVEMNNALMRAAMTRLGFTEAAAQALV